MPKIVFLGSCRFEPYEILAVPSSIKGFYRLFDNQFYSAIRKADLIFAYIPDGIGIHTQRDIDYAKSIGKEVIYVKD